MRRLPLVVLMVGAALAFAACSLNPQPFPPSSVDNGGTGADASIDSGAPPFDRDGGADASTTMPDSGFADASEDGGATDGSLDAGGDAAGDAESDATGD